ncbi:MAG: RNA 2'-phosphotransferase [Akkermansiaceae bacterium]
MPESEFKKSAWRGYRILLGIQWVGATLFFLSLAAVICFPEEMSWAGFFYVPGFLALQASYWFKCPRCRGGFFRTIGFSNPTTNSCRKCGLPKWEEPPYSGFEFPNSTATATARQYPVPDPQVAKRKTQLIFLALVLRDDPRAIGLKLDRDGWVSIEELLKRAKQNRIDLTGEDLNEILLDDVNPFEQGGFDSLIRYERKELT